MRNLSHIQAVTPHLLRGLFKTMSLRQLETIQWTPQQVRGDSLKIVDISKACLLFLVVLGLTACGGNGPQKASNPVQVQQADDVNKPCAVLVAEMNGINQAISRREEKTRLTPSNILSGDAGVSVDVGNLKVNDMSAPTEEEIDALFQRYEYLDLIARRKLCYQ